MFPRGAYARRHEGSRARSTPSRLRAQLRRSSLKAVHSGHIESKRIQTVLVCASRSALTNPTSRHHLIAGGLEDARLEHPAWSAIVDEMIGNGRTSSGSSGASGVRRIAALRRGLEHGRGSPRRRARSRGRSDAMEPRATVAPATLPRPPACVDRRAREPPMLDDEKTAEDRIALRGSEGQRREWDRECRSTR